MAWDLALWFKKLMPLVLQNGSGFGGCPMWAVLGWKGIEILTAVSEFTSSDLNILPSWNEVLIGVVYFLLSCFGGAEKGRSEIILGILER